MEFITRSSRSGFRRMSNKSSKKTIKRRNLVKWPLVESQHYLIVITLILISTRINKNRWSVPNRSYKLLQSRQRIKRRDPFNIPQKNDTNTRILSPMTSHQLIAYYTRYNINLTSPTKIGSFTPVFPISSPASRPINSQILIRTRQFPFCSEVNQRLEVWHYSKIYSLLDKKFRFGLVLF